MGTSAAGQRSRKARALRGIIYGYSFLGASCLARDAVGTSCTIATRAGPALRELTHSGAAKRESNRMMQQGGALGPENWG